MINTQGVGGSRDSWSQFMKVAQEARLRNSGFAQKAGFVSGVKEEKSQTSPVASSRGVAFSAGEPKVNSRILGGLFDAYA